MKYKQLNVTIPMWISCHTYLFGQADSRTYISNEKKHTYVMLEGLASDIWKLLCDEISEVEFNRWAQENGVADEVENFLNELYAQGLIILEQGYYAEEKSGYEPLDNNINDEEGSFVKEMQMWLLKNKFLFSLFFELTYRCNLKCVHCYNPKDMSTVEIDFEQCKKAIDDAYDLGCFRITFSGGESTLHNRFSDLVAYARSKRMSVDIFTNGQTLAKDYKLYKQLLEQYPYRICVSLYSTDKITHERVTAVEGSFENTYSLIRQLRNDKVNVQIKNFLLNFNCLDCVNVKKMAEEIGASSIADISLIPTIDGDKKTLQYALSTDELYRLYTDSDSPLYIGKDYVGWKDYKKRKEDFPCLGGFTGLCINPYGDVAICVSMPFFVGNLSEISLTKIWQAAMDKEPNSKLYQWQKLKISDFSECYKEEYCKYCNFCPGMGYLENGYLHKSNILCTQAKAKMKAHHFLQKSKI